MTQPITQRFSVESLALTFLVVLLMPLSVFAGPPTEQIRATVDEVVAILKETRRTPGKGDNESREQIKRAIVHRFDFNEMAKRCLGFQWRRLSAGERDEFTRLFTELLERSYLNQIQAYHGEQITFVRERRNGDYAEVESYIVTGTGTQLSVNYKSLLVNGEWKVYDVVAENISMVNNFRSQFRRILARYSYDELVRRIRQKL